MEQKDTDKDGYGGSADLSNQEAGAVSSPQETVTPVPLTSDESAPISSMPMQEVSAPVVPAAGLVDPNPVGQVAMPVPNLVDGAPVNQVSHPAHFASTKKFTKGVVRTVIGHTLAIAIVGLGGWFVWQWSGIFGVHYKEVGRPYLTMQQSLSSVSFALIDSYPHAVYESSASSALKTDDNYKDMTASVARFDEATAEIEKFKAFKHGEVSGSLQSIVRKNKRYSAYVKERAESYKLVQGAVDACGDISYIDSDALARYATCKQQLLAIKQAEIPNNEFKAFFEGYKKYIDTASGLATAYSTKTSTWSEVFKASNQNSDEFRELRDATRIKLGNEEEKLNPREEIKKTADKLADLIEAEKSGSGH